MYPNNFSTSTGLKKCGLKIQLQMQLVVDMKIFLMLLELQLVIAGPAIPEEKFTPVENSNYNNGLAARRAHLWSSNPRGFFECYIPLEHFLYIQKFYKRSINILKYTLTLT